MVAFEKTFTDSVRNVGALPCGAQRRPRHSDPDICGLTASSREGPALASPAKSRQPAAPTSLGFTLVELIVTLLLLGILAVVAIPKMSGMKVIQQRGDYDKVVSTLDYARRSAIAQRRNVCVAISSNAVTLTVDASPPEANSGTCANNLALPSPDSQCGAVTNRTCTKTLTITPSTTPFTFDPLGRASTPVTITVSGFPTITVEGETGYVH